jgi:hypothetical protein
VLNADGAQLVSIPFAAGEAVSAEMAKFVLAMLKAGRDVRSARPFESDLSGSEGEDSDKGDGVD